MSNRFPNNENNENNNEHVHIIEERGDLCNDCRWVSKCHKYQTVTSVLTQLEQHMFKEFTVDLNTIAMITYCPTYAPHPMAGVETEDEEQ